MSKIISKYGKRLSKIRKSQVCNGCGRILPKGSLMMIWQVWIKKKRYRFRFCSDCQKIIYECQKRPPLSYQDNEFLIRDMCQCCNRFPICENVKYLRNSNKGDLHLGDIPEIESK